MLYPRIVRISGRRYTVFPTNIIFELVLPPVGEVERRICHYKVRFQRFMQIIEECICLILSQISPNSMNRHVDFCHFPCVSIRFLTTNRYTVSFSAVRFNKICRLHKHTATTTTWIIDTTIFKRLQNSNDCFNYTFGGIEFAAFYTFISGELFNAILIGCSK